MASKPSHTESKIQIQCVTWLNYQHPHLAPLFFAVPNGGYRNAAEASIMKAEGVRAGVADLIFNIPSGPYTQLNIEMKTTSKNSRQSASQKRYQQYASAVGIKYIVCRSFEQFKQDVSEYIAAINPDLMRKLYALHQKEEQEEVMLARLQYQKRCNTSTTIQTTL